MGQRDVARVVADLVERVERLEAGVAAKRPPTRRDVGLPEQLLHGLSAQLDGTDESGMLVYAGAGPWDDGTVAWQMGRSWPDVIAQTGSATAQVFAALANPSRIRIICELLAGSMTTAELTERLDQPSSGQLFHHLKELLAAGLIHQPLRGTYAIRRHDVVPLLAALSCASDLAAGDTDGEPA